MKGQLGSSACSGLAGSKSHLSIVPSYSAVRYVRTMSRLSLLPRRNRFGLAAFLIPLGIRAVPEVIVGPYPVGFDTIAFFVPNAGTRVWRCHGDNMAKIAITVAEIEA